MRRWIGWIGVLTLLTLAASGGCGSSTTTPPPGQTHNGTISANIGGDFSLTFNCTTAYGLVVAPDAGEGTPGSMHIQGPVTQGGDTYLLDIQVYHDPATGTYVLDFPPVDGVGSIARNSTGNVSETGSVTFTQVSSTRLAGTFSFTAFRMVGVGEKVTVTVTDGTFDVPVIASF
jgi:hypothetical protein